MGREVRRVPLDFDWPINKVWKGFINPHHTAKPCEACKGASGFSTGYSPEAVRLQDLWYGYIPFKPEDRGSVLFRSDDTAIVTRAIRNVTHSPEYYGTGNYAVRREAERLCQHYNTHWLYHLNADDVAALIEAGRLKDLTHTWDRENGWQPKNPPHIPTPREVNEWSLSGMGHDSINSWVCIRAECKRLGVPDTCAVCDGNAEIWPSKEAREIYENWEQENPPTGDGYQIWETVSEGSPISPVFATPEELARHMAGTRWGADQGTPYETWLEFIRGPGWAPSMIMTGGQLYDGVTATVLMDEAG